MNQGEGGKSWCAERAAIRRETQWATKAGADKVLVSARKGSMENDDKEGGDERQGSEVTGRKKQEEQSQVTMQSAKV